jgi:decaprenyl-phosphate phosphoribosyltransferase
MHPYLKLLRPKQYVKNVFIIAPLFFSGSITIEKIEKTFIAFFAFCCIASVVYIFNDSKDLETDKLHPKKKNRPIASGAVSINIAYSVALLLLLLGCTLAFISQPKILLVFAVYLGINICYSIGLKQFVIIDVSIIAFGFLLRLFVGSLASSSELSIWIIIETYLLALFLALAKRRTDLVLHLDGVSTRKNIEKYNLKFIDTTLSSLTALITIAYLIFSISPDIQSRYHSKLVYMSCLFVLHGLLRYLKLALVDQTPLAPHTLVLKDRQLQLTIFLWVVFMGGLLYVKV